MLASEQLRQGFREFCNLSYSYWFIVPPHCSSAQIRLGMHESGLEEGGQKMESVLVTIIPECCGPVGALVLRTCLLSIQLQEFRSKSEMITA